MIGEDPTATQPSSFTNCAITKTFLLPTIEGRKVLVIAQFVNDEGSICHTERSSVTDVWSSKIMVGISYAFFILSILRIKNALFSYTYHNLTRPDIGMANWFQILSRHHLSIMDLEIV